MVHRAPGPAANNAELMRDYNRDGISALRDVPSDNRFTAPDRTEAVSVPPGHDRNKGGVAYSSPDQQ